MKVLKLFGRQDCHLCDEMHAELNELIDSLGLKPGSDISIQVVDIDTSAELDADMRSRLSWRIPVLSADGMELCHYRLDHESLREYLNA